VLDSDPTGPWRQTILRFDGAAWYTLKVDEAVDGWGGDLAVTPSGDVYLSMGGEILRYDAGGAAGGWQTVASIGRDPDNRLSVAGDGSIWYGAPWGIGRIVR
jgi:hypothetical protein